MSAKGSEPCATKAATNMVKAAGAAIQRVLKPTKMSAGAMSSPKMVRAREMVVPRPKKSINFTGSSAANAWLSRSYFAHPWGIIKKEVPARSRNRPNACVMGTNIGDVLIVRRPGRNPLFQLLDLAVREGIAIGRHRRKTTLVLDCSQEAVVARSGHHAGMGI